MDGELGVRIRRDQGHPSGDGKRQRGAAVCQLHRQTEYREDPGYTMDRRSTAIRVDHRLGEAWTGYLRYNHQRQDLSDISDPAAPEEEKLENLKLGDIGAAVQLLDQKVRYNPEPPALLMLARLEFRNPLWTQRGLDQSL